MSLKRLFRLWLGLYTVAALYSAPVSAEPIVVFSDNFEGAFDWRRSGGRGEVTTGYFIYKSAWTSMWIGEGPVDATSPRIDASSDENVQSVDVAVWVQRGYNGWSSDYPESGEDLIFEYRDATNTWVELERFEGGGAAGEIFDRHYALPASAAVSDLQLRFSLTNGSGRGYDYWHVDDVVVTLQTGPATTAATYIIGGNSRRFSRNNGNWAWDGSEMSAFRSAAENPANFGPNGVKLTTVDTIDLLSISGASLLEIDAFVASWWTDGDASAYRNTLQTWHLGGGDLVLLQDDSAHDAVGAQLGFPTIGTSAGPTTISAPLQAPVGPFGVVNPLGQIGEFGYLNQSSVLAAGGTICGRDRNGRVTVACWDEGEYAPGAGKLIIATDVDFLTGNFGGANYALPNDKGRFGLNLIAFLLDEFDTQPVAHFAFEQSSWSGAGVIIEDYSGNGRAGISVGAASSAGRGYICRGATIPENTSSAIVDAIDTRVDIDTVLGPAGSISFWWQARANWNDGRSRTLFDATERRVNSAQDKYFYLSKEANGSLLFSYEDSSDRDFNVRSSALGFAAGEWVHIVVTWDYENDRTAIFVNGQSVATGSDNTNGQMPAALANLHFGDNSSPYQSPGSSAAGVLDEIMLYDRVLEVFEIDLLNQATRACDICSLGSFDLLQPTYGLACPGTRMPVEIVARCDDGTPFTEYVGTVNLSTSGGSESVLFAAANGGSPINSITFDGSEGGQAEVFVYHRDETPDLRLTAIDTLAGISSTAASATDVRTAGLAVTGAQPFSCGRSIDLQVTAIGQSDDGSGSCTVIEGFDGTKSVKSWFTMNLDSGEAPPQPDSINAPLLVNGTAVDADTLASADNITLEFVAGVASSSLGYADAGQLLALNFLHDTAPYDGSTPELMPLLGSTGAMVISPEAFAMTLPANHDCSTLDQNCSAFVPAGANFEHTVSARCATPAGTLGPVATQFRGDIGLTHSIVAPSGGSPGTLRHDRVSIDASSGALATTPDQALSEVGIFRLAASPEPYFGVSYPAVEAIVGRLYPAFLSVQGNSPMLQAPTGCGFGFQSQPIDYSVSPELTVSGYNQQGVLTQNYDGAFFKFGHPVPDYSNTAVTLSALTPDLTHRSFDRLTAPEYNGQATITIVGDQVGYLRAAPRPPLDDEPFNASFNLDFPAIELTDADGACYRLNSAGGCLPLQLELDATSLPLRIVYGRMAMENAFGPELADLIVPVRSEYWTGTAWAVNDLDSCSVYDTTQITLDDFTGALEAGDTKVMIGSTEPASQPFLAGHFADSAPLLLSRPLADQTGSVRLTHAVPEWLQLDWDLDGAPDDPSAIATFGQYRGHDRIIYWRESLD
ncbi:LamG domain-containing protein [Allohahella marinimesophila]|uniref:DUF6701 domain-containing protein n=1 Tax=Allohahella marinimesophila TaxID=1054972 RepID=A0ABP7NWU1_9GAMM